MLKVSKAKVEVNGGKKVSVQLNFLNAGVSLFGEAEWFLRSK